MRIVLMLVLLCLLGQIAPAQCAPDTTLPHSTHYPANLPSGCVGVPYHETIHFAFPRDSNVAGINVTFLSFELIGDNLPAGLSTSCNIASCKWTPSSTPTNSSHIFACVDVSGVPTQTFNGTVTLQIEGVGQAFGINQTKVEPADFGLKIYTPSSPAWSHAVSGTTVSFTDLTQHGTSPAYSHNWNFGDGNFSSQASPTHTYANPGIYQVCMVLSNSCGDSSVCKTVTTDGVSVEEGLFPGSWSLSPTAAGGIFRLQASLEHAMPLRLQLFDLQGREVWSQGLGQARETVRDLDLNGLPAGLYLCRLAAGPNFSSQKLFIP